MTRRTSAPDRAILASPARRPRKPQGGAARSTNSRAAAAATAHSCAPDRSRSDTCEVAKRTSPTPPAVSPSSPTGSTTTSTPSFCGASRSGTRSDRRVRRARPVSASSLTAHREIGGPSSSTGDRGRRHPRDFRENNGRVVGAFSAAVSAIAGATDTVSAITRRARRGGDTDTVAAITGALAGPCTAVGGCRSPGSGRCTGGPASTQRTEPARVACHGAAASRPARGGPTAATVPSAHFDRTDTVPAPGRSRVWSARIARPRELPHGRPRSSRCAASGHGRCRAGTRVCRCGSSIKPDCNDNLDFVLTEAADAVAALRRNAGRCSCTVPKVAAAHRPWRPCTQRVIVGWPCRKHGMTCALLCPSSHHRTF